MIDYKKLIESLRSISEICFDIEDCDDCPMCSEDGNLCLVKKNAPWEWCIVEPQEIVRLMK